MGVFQAHVPGRETAPAQIGRPDYWQECSRTQQVVFRRLVHRASVGNVSVRQEAGSWVWPAAKSSADSAEVLDVILKVRLWGELWEGNRDPQLGC